MAKAIQSGDVFLLTNISSRDNFTEKDSNEVRWMQEVRWTQLSEPSRTETNLQLI